MQRLRKMRWGDQARTGGGFLCCELSRPPPGTLETQVRQQDSL